MALHAEHALSIRAARRPREASVSRARRLRRWCPRIIPTRTFEKANVGYGSTVATIMTVIIVLLTVVFINLQSRQELAEF